MTAALVSTFGVAATARGPDPGSGVASTRVLAADAGGFALEVRVPQPAARWLGHADGSCVVPALAPLAEGATPAPGDAAYGWLVGVPRSGMARATVVDVVEETWTGTGALCAEPAASNRLTIGVPLAQLDAAGAPPTAPSIDLPPSSAPIAELAAAGDLRGQPIERLRVRVLARTPTGRLLVRTRLRLRVDYHCSDPVVRVPTEAGPFALVAAVLLNADFLPGRAAERPIGPLPAAKPAAAATVWDGPADASALKIAVDRDGPTTISGADLARAGWELAALDPAALSLTRGGTPVAFAIDGLVGGRLVAASRISFAGLAMSGPYTRTNVYWLRQTGAALRMGERHALPDAGPAADSFGATLHLEQDTRWLPSMDPDDGDDRWMWGDALAWNSPAHKAVTLTVPLGNLAPTPAPARLVLRLQGYTADARVDPDHHLRVLWNDELIAAPRFDGMGGHVITATVPGRALLPADNRLAVQMVGDTGALVDSVYLNRLALDYRAGYRATGDVLDFAAPAPGRQTFAVTGFTSADVRVQDITDPARPVRLVGIDVTPDAAGGFRVRFGDTAAADTRYRAFAAGGERPAAAIDANGPSDLHAGGTGADWVVITHPRFRAALAPLVERRRAQGLRTLVVDVDDIYDEFSAGIFDPRAIRAFLRQAYTHWPRPAPTYVLLVGESNLDYRRGYNAGPQNDVPAVMLDTRLGGLELTAYASDQWYATQSDDDAVPDMLVGRFSVSTAAEAATVVAKTLQYEQQPADAPWRRRAVMVVDDTDAASLEPFSEELTRHIPSPGGIQRFYAARYPVTRSIAADIGAAVDGGALVMNFAGHANVALWGPWAGGGYIFDNAGIGRLTNGAAMPVFTAVTCMNGWINHPLKPVSMTERWLLQPNGGGAVAWASSGFTTLGPQWVMFRHLFDGLYDGRWQPFGALTAQAGALALGQSAGNRDMVAMFVLLGDPALVVAGGPRLPTPTPLPTGAATPLAAYLPLARQHDRP